MKKKILLYLATLIVVAFIFAWVTGIFSGTGGWRITHRPVHPIPVFTTKGMAHLVVEVRSSKGVLEYVLRARQALPKGDGRYLLTEPSMQFFSADHQSTIIASDMGDVYVDQVGGAMSSHVYPRKGKLFGHPTITIGPVKSFIHGVRKRQPGQMQIRFSRPLSFNYQQGIITSSGPIHLRSDQADFDGLGLTAQVDLTHKKLTYLRIDKGIRLVLRHIDNTASLGQTPASTPLAATSHSPEEHHPAETLPTKANTPAAAIDNAPVVYRLDFIDHVKALVGPQEIQARRFIIYFSGGAPQSPRPVAAPPPANRPTIATPPTTSPVLHSNRSADLFLTWTGPMIMRPQPPPTAHLLGPKDIFFEARGQAGHPVRLTDDKTLTALAQKVTYQTQPQILQLLPGAGATVALNSSQFGTVHCAGVTFNRLTNRVLLTGPGTAMLDPSHGTLSRSWQAIWQTSVGLQLSSAPDAKQPGRTTLVVRRVVLRGQAQVKRVGQSIQADELAACLTAPGLAHRPQALQRLLAIGHVQVLSQASPAKGTPASRMTCHQLLIQCLRPAGHQTPVPHNLLAIGHVHLKLSPATANNRQAPAAYTIVTPHLTATLAPTRVRPKPSGPLSPSPARFTVTRFGATAGVQLRINNTGRPIVATATTMSGNRRTGILELTGGTPVNSPLWATITQQGNFISGLDLILHQKSQSIFAHGPGKFVILRKKSAGTAPKPGVEILWRKFMRYRGTSHKALFVGHVKAHLLARPDQQSRLACHQLTILLAKPTAARPDATDQLHLVDLQALGVAGHQLNAMNASFNPHGLLQTRLYVQGNSLHYNALLRRLTVAGPGQMSLEDYRGESVAKRQAAAKKPHSSPLEQPRGQSAFAWSQGLHYHGNTGVLSLRGRVRMVYKPLHPLQASMVGTPDGSGRVQRPAARADRRARLILLDCRRLMAQLTRPKQAGSSAMELGMGGPMKLNFVQAQAAALELLGIRMTADVLKFNANKQQAVALGLNGHEAVVSSKNGQAHGQARKIIWDMTKGRAGLIFIQPRGTISTR